MADDINRVMLVGRLVKLAEHRETANGNAVVNFALAMTKSVKKNDQWVEESNFFDCVYFGKRAAGVAPYLIKGQKVAIDGKLDQNRWETQDGQKRSKVEIVVQNLQLLGGKPDNSQPIATPQQQPQQSNFKDDVPF